MRNPMTAFESTIEALEHQWMRAWIQGDRKSMKSLSAREFIFLLGAETPAILDRTSWLEAAGTRMRCHSYRFGPVYIRRIGVIASFASNVTIEMELDGKPLSGDVWQTDLWRRKGFSQRWKLAERTLSRPDGDLALPLAIKAMQLWK